MSETVTHAGRTYRLDDLAHYMDDLHREAVHVSHEWETPQEWWDEFARRWPDEADHLAEITPQAPSQS